MSKINMQSIPVGAIGTNCYIIYNETSMEGVIIDPGGEPDKIINFVNNLKVIPKAILLTHGHFDHILGCGKIAFHFHIEIYVYEEENEMMMDPGLNLSASMAGGYAIEPNVLLKDNQKLDLIGTSIKVIHTPGHTSGGCCYYLENEKMLFCGDTMFMESVGRTDFPKGNHSAIIKSLNEKILTLPEEVKAYPGHGPSTSIGYEKRNNPYADGLF